MRFGARNRDFRDRSFCEPLITYAALLAPEPIPLFLFSEARGTFGEPFASQLTGDGLDEAIAALRTFALIERETIVDERVVRPAGFAPIDRPLF